ncbi:hypothetical protein GDO78_014444 [Eleutherodactylus coqui]|uniref:Uncharacterized protein n=1 Tax=Eleutherodactylus coqui TaxID=57060 RepID=A0A8J6JXM6_ELECQ|nr:hypothetical protein GDO78_014444 [Eleutherodactylus coqui]
MFRSSPLCPRRAYGALRAAYLLAEAGGQSPGTVGDRFRFGACEGFPHPSEGALYLTH